MKIFAVIFGLVLTDCIENWWDPYGKFYPGQSNQTRNGKYGIRNCVSWTVQVILTLSRRPFQKIIIFGWETVCTIKNNFLEKTCTSRWNLPQLL